MFCVQLFVCDDFYYIRYNNCGDFFGIVNYVNISVGEMKSINYVRVEGN